MGWQAPLVSRWRAGAELLAGAAGGGGVDVRGGRIVQPMAHLGYEVRPGLALQLDAGYLRSSSGTLRSPVLGASMAFSFGVGSLRGD